MIPFSGHGDRFFSTQCRRRVCVWFFLSLKAVSNSFEAVEAAKKDRTMDRWMDGWLVGCWKNRFLVYFFRQRVVFIPRGGSSSSPPPVGCPVARLPGSFFPSLITSLALQPTSAAAARLCTGLCEGKGKRRPWKTSGSRQFILCLPRKWFPSNENETKKMKKEAKKVFWHRHTHSVEFYASWNFFNSLNKEKVLSIPAIDGDFNERKVKQHVHGLQQTAVNKLAYLFVSLVFSEPNRLISPKWRAWQQ